MNNETRLLGLVFAPTLSIGLWTACGSNDLPGNNVRKLKRNMNVMEPHGLHG